MNKLGKLGQLRERVDQQQSTFSIDHVVEEETPIEEVTELDLNAGFTGGQALDLEVGAPAGESEEQTDSSGFFGSFKIEEPEDLEPHNTDVDQSEMPVMQEVTVGGEFGGEPHPGDFKNEFRIPDDDEGESEDTYIGEDMNAGSDEQEASAQANPNDYSFEIQDDDSEEAGDKNETIEEESDSFEESDYSEDESLANEQEEHHQSDEEPQVTAAGNPQKGEYVDMKNMNETDRRILLQILGQTKPNFDNLEFMGEDYLQGLWENAKEAVKEAKLN